MTRKGSRSMRSSSPGVCAAVLAAACTALVAPAGAAAQTYDISAGWGGGYVQYAPFVEAGDDTPRDVGFGGTWVALVQVEKWELSHWLGLRLGGYYSHGTVTLPSSNNRAAAWGVETAALVRVVPPTDRTYVSAYLIGGGGMNWFDLGEGNNVPVPGSNLVYSQDDARQFTILGGGGIEVLTGFRVMDGEIGVRAEGVDHIVLDRPFRPAGGSSAGMMHNLRFTLTLFSGVPSLF